MDNMLKDLTSSFQLHAGVLKDAIRKQAASAGRVAGALWRRDPSIWSADRTVQQEIANRFGWLTSPFTMRRSLERPLKFAERARRDGFANVVLLGMGGSSLAAEVLRSIVGTAPGWPQFRMLDSTNPASVLAAGTEPANTLYLFASKSGTTIEPNSFAAHFRRELERARVPRWADHFVAITDEGTPLADRSRAEGFRETFINPSDIGGRYSALSFFGLVPAALMGQDIGALVDNAAAMLETASSIADPLSNPAVGLGLAIAAAARAGRDKLTLLLPPEWETFGLWVDQQVAESTGKDGIGVVPIADETTGTVAQYGNDRLYVHVTKPGTPLSDPVATLVSRLEASNAPVVTLPVSGPLALGAEFIRWEIATVVAGGLLGINPFNEPDVEQAKDATQVLLRQFKSEGQLPAPAVDSTLEQATLQLSSAARQRLRPGHPEEILTLIEEHDYLALLAYPGPDRELARVLNEFRIAVRDRTRTATTFCYGPRYLHSTGQLHKGGPNTGVFILVTATPSKDLDIPGEKFSFGTLERAQALGDFASLDASNRRVLHVHLPSPDATLLRRVCTRLLSSINP